MVELFDESEETKKDKKGANEGTYIALSAFVFLVSGFFAVGSMAGGMLQSTQQLSLYVQSIIVPLSIIEAYGIYRRRYWSIPYGAVLTLVNVFGAVRFGLFALFISIALVSVLSYLIKNKNLFSTGRKDFVIVVILILLTGVYFLPLSFLKDEKELLEEYKDISKGAKSKEDASICNLIGHEGYRNSCMKSVYVHLANLTLCDKLTKENLRENCKDAIKRQFDFIREHYGANCYKSNGEYYYESNEHYCEKLGGEIQ